jgi:hypothetical protein
LFLIGCIEEAAETHLFEKEAADLAVPFAGGPDYEHVPVDVYMFVHMWNG